MNKNLKEKIISSFNAETPDLKEKILNSCQNQEQIPLIIENKSKRRFNFGKLVAIACCFFMFCTGILLGKFIPNPQNEITPSTRLYLDVNPSIELVLDKNNTVISCNALNDDAEIILTDITLDGVNLKTAISALVGSMYIKGYLSLTDNSMLISVDSTDKINTNTFLSFVTNQVNAVFSDTEMECSIIAQGVPVDESLKNRAKENGISVGKMHLLDKIVGYMDEVTSDDILNLKDMSIKDLNLIYSQKDDGDIENENELISGTVSVPTTKDDALNAVLNEIDKSITDIEEYFIYILPSKHGENKAVYQVILKFYDDYKHYRYEVDFKTGEVTISNNYIPPNDHNPPRK